MVACCGLHPKVQMHFVPAAPSSPAARGPPGPGSRLGLAGFKFEGLQVEGFWLEELSVAAIVCS